MALSSGEANACNTVARYFLGIPSHAGPVTDDQALRALELLAAKAYKTLGAGLRETDIHDAFEQYLARKAESS